MALHLDELEARHDYVLLVGDDKPTAWSERCSRRSDEMLLLAQAAEPPVLNPTETQFLMQRPGRAEAAEVLVLLHLENQHCPSGTEAWLARRPAAGGRWPTTSTSALPCSATWPGWRECRAAARWAWYWPVVARAAWLTRV